MNLDDFLNQNLESSLESKDSELGYFDNLKGIIEKDYSESLTEDDVVNDPRLMEYVYGFLEGRRGPEAGTLANQSYGLATGLSGGSTVGTNLTSDYRSLDPKEAWEIFQNHQRSFAGGQTVTTLNELVYAGNVDGNTKERLGSGYYLFENMDNAFTGDGSWRDMGDAILDYGKAAVWDPTTIASFGVGKLLTGGASKAGSVAVKQAMIEGVKSGVSKSAMKKAALKSTAYTGSVLASDALMEAAKDVAYQNTLITTGAQAEYQGAQTAVAALGSMLVPVGLYGVSKTVTGVRKRVSGVFGESIKQGDTLGLTAKEATEAVNKRLKKDVLIDTIDSSFGAIQGDPTKGLDWAALSSNEVPLDISEMKDFQYENAFMRRFWLGSQDGDQKGYFEALNEAGFVVHPSMLEEVGNITGVLANAIDYLDDEVIESLMSSYETANGRKLPFVERTAEGLRNAWTASTREAGRELWLSSTMSRIQKSNRNASAFIEELSGDKVANPRMIPYAVSAYKRSLTAHPATTGANVKGFGALVSLDVAGDMASSVIYKAGELGARSMDALSPSSGWDVLATENGNMAYGSFTGAMKKGIAVFSPDLSFEYAEKVLNEFPEINKTLLNHLAGDSGLNDAAEFFQVRVKDPKTLKGKASNLAVSATEKYINAAQAVSLVKVQDEITKKLYFGGALDKNISKVYGMSPDKFWSNPDSLIEMHSDNFVNKVVKKALTETQDVTASRTWSQQPKYKQDHFSLRNAAAQFEYLSRETALGYVVPFASFMNTTFMHLGDYSGLNAVRLLHKQTRGIPLDYSQKSGVELAGKALVGWGTVAATIPSAMEQISEGLEWNQERREDGSIANVKYDWPWSQVRLMSYAFAHAYQEDSRKLDVDKVPQSIWDNMKEISNSPEFGEIRGDIGAELLGGQGVRGLVDTFKDMETAFSKSKEQGVTRDILWNDIMFPMVAKVAQGHTRPLDPLNAMVGLAKGGNMTPDRSQGNKNVRQALKYVDHLTGVGEDWERKAIPGRGYQNNSDYDLGAMAGGVRSNPVPTLWESMMGSADLDPWENISKNWVGGPEVRNVADALVSPVLQNEAMRAISQEPDFFSYDLAAKQRIMKQVNERARTTTRDLIADGVGGKGLVHLTALSSVKKEEMRKIMDFLELEGKPEDLLDDPNGEEILKKILFLSKNFDDIFLGIDELKD